MRRIASKTLLESKRDDLSHALAQRDQYRLLNEGKETPFWKEISRRVKAKQETTEEKLDDYLSESERSVWALLEQRKMYRFFGSLVNESDGAIEMIEKRISRLESEIKELQKRARK